MSKSQNVSKKTLDTQHLTKVQEFCERDTVIQNIQNDIQNCLYEIDNYKSRNDLNDDEFEKYMSLYDNVNELKKQLDKYEKHDEEVDYYINTAPILFQYYDILENGKDVSSAPKLPTKANSILNYFVQKPQVKQEKAESTVPQVDRATLLEKYMHITDSNFIKPSEETTDKCPYCESVDRNIMLNDGMIYCNNCHTIEHIIIDHERPSYKDPPKEIKGPLNGVKLFLKVVLQKELLVAYAA